MKKLPVEKTVIKKNENMTLIFFNEIVLIKQKIKYLNYF